MAAHLQTAHLHPSNVIEKSFSDESPETTQFSISRRRNPPRPHWLHSASGGVERPSSEGKVKGTTGLGSDSKAGSRRLAASLNLTQSKRPPIMDPTTELASAPNPG